MTRDTNHGEAAGADHRAGGGADPALRRTAAFLAAGGALLVAGWLAQPRFTASRVAPEAQSVLFPELSDAAKAASLEIVSYDDELATLRPFKVVQSGGVWVLPSHENYPADAREQLAAAATELVDRPILGVVSTSPGDHETYGVIEPDPEKIKPGMTGVGQLVDIRDASGNRLARLIIGKEDKRPAGAGGERALRFVRKAGQDPVYRVELDTAKFTTKFDDWIEKDLLKLSPWDVRRLTIDDSTCTFGIDETSGRPMVSQDRKSRIDLAYDDKDSKWSLVRLEAFAKGNKPVEEKLAADEELASAKLNDLRNALGDLKIVDVARKPSGLSGDLKAAEKFTADREAVTSLAQRGFYPFQSGDILSSNGETVVGMKDGVEYLLRFGNGTAVAADEDKKKDDEKGKPAAAETTGRYLFVMARFNESLLEKPVMEPLPEVPAVPGGDAADKKAKDPAADEDAKPAGKEDAKPAGKDEPAKEQAADNGEEKTEEPAGKKAVEQPGSDAAETTGTKTDSDTAADASAADPAVAEDAAAKPAAKPDEAAKPADGQAAVAAEGPQDAAKDGAKPGTAAEAIKKADEAEAKAQAALEERRRVERENRRRQEEYDDKVKAAQKRVRELNSRFADWYYVVSDSEYAKIHLDRAGVVQKKPAEAK